MRERDSYTGMTGELYSVRVMFPPYFFQVSIYNVLFQQFPCCRFRSIMASRTIFCRIQRAVKVSSKYEPLKADKLRKRSSRNVGLSSFGP